MKFTDRNQTRYEIKTYGVYSHLKSSKQLKQALDKATSFEGLRKNYPSLSNEAVQRLVTAYSSKTYIEIMNSFGVRYFSKRL